MDHDPDKHDDQAIALALAANHLITMPPKRHWVAERRIRLLIDKRLEMIRQPRNTIHKRVERGDIGIGR